MSMFATAVFICSGMIGNYQMDLKFDSQMRSMEINFAGPNEVFEKKYTNLHRQGGCFALDDVRLCGSLSHEVHLDVSLLSRLNGGVLSGWLDCK